MRCPVDNELLVMTERSGVEIDYCPKCRGVWLDRGELDKIVERSGAAPSAAAAPAPQAAPLRDRDPLPQHYRDRDHDDDDDRYRDRRGKRRDSFLGDLFDF